LPSLAVAPARPTGLASHPLGRSTAKTVPFRVIGLRDSFAPVLCPRIGDSKIIGHLRVRQKHDAELAGIDRGQVKIELEGLDVLFGAAALAFQPAPKSTNDQLPRSRRWSATFPWTRTEWANRDSRAERCKAMQTFVTPASSGFGVRPGASTCF
jgi:hypothetical protein